MITWNDAMLIGIPQVDSQHKLLVEAINKLMEACGRGEGRSEIEKTLNFVVSYTKEHFKDEEVVQANLGFPGATPHKWIHTQFIMQVGTLVQEFKKDGPSVTLVGKLNKSLCDWVVNHIMNEDKKFGEYLTKANSKSA